MGDLIRLFDDHGEGDKLTLFDVGALPQAQRLAGHDDADQEAADAAIVADFQLWAERLREFDQ